MSEKPISTIGFERRFNYLLHLTDKLGFVDQVTHDLPPQPPQFGRIVELNRGPFLTDELELRALSIGDFEEYRESGALVLDTRVPEAFGAGHIPGAINVDPHGGQFGTRASWIIPNDTPVVLVLERNEDQKAASGSLAAVGQFGVAGFLDGGMETWDSSGRPLKSITQLLVRELSALMLGERSPYSVLDVREGSEWREGHIDGAQHIPFHDLKAHLDDLPGNKPIATICGGGTRSSIAASILQREGFDVINVVDGMDAWRAAGHPVLTS
jgi:hydroxyacylglutathione hydrolase